MATLISNTVLLASSVVLQTVIYKGLYGMNRFSLSLKEGIKQCLGGLKCSQNTKKNKTTLKVSFKVIFNVHFANLVSKEYFPIQCLVIFLLYE